MVSSITGSDSNIQQLMEIMLNKMKSADTDGTKGLSKSELASIDTGDDTGGSAFLKSLSEQFDELDTDGNGQLTSEEIANAKPPEPMGPPPGLQLTSSEDSNDALSTNQDLIEQLLEASSEAFVNSYEDTSSTDSDASKAESLLASADSDGSSGLSLDELSSIDSSGKVGQAGFVNDLIKNFDNYDLNGDGQLAQSELEAALPDGPFSQQEEKAIAESDGTGFSTSSFSDLLSKASSSSFVQNLLNSYKDGGLSTLLSSLNVAV